MPQNDLEWCYEPLEFFLQTFVNRGFFRNLFLRVILRNFHLTEKNLSYEPFDVELGVYTTILSK